MSYKTILVHADHSSHLVQRVRAASLAGSNINTHIVGVAVNGVSHYLRLWERTRQQGGQVTDAWHEEVGRLHKSAEAALARFEDAARAAGLPSFECRLVADDELDGLSLHARYSDLTILTQWDPDAPAHPMADDLPEYVALSSGRPVLVLPHRHEIEVLANKPLLAWDGSLEATRAVHHAMLRGGVTLTVLEKMTIPVLMAH